MRSSNMMSPNKPDDQEYVKVKLTTPQKLTLQALIQLSQPSTFNNLSASIPTSPRSRSPYKKHPSQSYNNPFKRNFRPNSKPKQSPWKPYVPAPAKQVRAFNPAPQPSNIQAPVPEDSSEDAVTASLLIALMGQAAYWKTLNESIEPSESGTHFTLSL